MPFEKQHVFHWMLSTTLVSVSSRALPSVRKVRSVLSTELTTKASPRRLKTIDLIAAFGDTSIVSSTASVLLSSTRSSPRGVPA